MRKVVTTQTYYLLAQDRYGYTSDVEYPGITFTQHRGDQLDLWNIRKSDGFHFVYCNRLKIGYWVTPKHVTEIGDEVEV